MNEFDDTLGRLFAEARESLPAEDFLESVALGIRRAQRRRAIWRAAFMAAAVVLALLLTPYIVAASLAWLPATGNALASPITWVFALAIAAFRIRSRARFR